MDGLRLRFDDYSDLASTADLSDGGGASQQKYHPGLPPTCLLLLAKRVLRPKVRQSEPAAHDAWLWWRDRR